MTTPALKRSLGVVLLLMFGLGNILGAGIYVLVGKVAGEAGYFAPLSFLVAAIVAAFSALSYSELAARFPEAGGEVVYTEQAFHLHWLSLSVGVLIAAAGMLSAATITRGFAGYVQVFWDAPTPLIISLGIGTLAAVAIWGVRESLTLAGLFTIVEAGGLLMVIGSAASEPGRWLDVFQHWPGNLTTGVVGGVLTGAFLAFYAFIGFEDMVNLAEEARNPQRDMPVAVVLVLVVSTVFYALTVLAALAYMTPGDLDASAAPLADVYEQATGSDPVLLTLIAVFAVINGALVQMIMVSRLLYGMGKRSRLFGVFFRVHPRTRTPIVATLTVAVVILALALWFPVRALAEYTSAVVLAIFILVNASLIRVKRRAPVYGGHYVVASWVPMVGMATTIALLLYVVWSELLR